MMKLTLKLNSLDDVKRFIGITSRYDAELSLENGCYSVDAKSILGVFSMDLSQPVQLVCRQENEKLKEELRAFIAA